jgi:hypothetical protein
MCFTAVSTTRFGKGRFRTAANDLTSRYHEELSTQNG